MREFRADQFAFARFMGRGSGTGIFAPLCSKHTSQIASLWWDWPGFRGILRDESPGALPVTYDCQGCDRTDLQLADRYEGRPVGAWGKVMICSLCREWGIAVLPSKLETHLKSLGVTLQHREDGSVHVPE